MDIQNLLESIGLTKQEAKCYLAIYRLKESKAGELSKFSEIATSNLYPVIDSLIQKGLISYKLKNNIKIFTPAPIESISHLVEEKQKKLDEQKEKVEEAIKKLKQSPETETISDYRYFEGIQGIKSMWHEINDYMSPKTIIKIYTGKKESYENLIGFYNEHHKLRAKKKVKEEMIFPFEDKKLAQKRKDKLTEVRFMELKNDAEWGVVGDWFYLNYFPVSRKLRAFLIKDKVFAQTFEQVFDNLWKQAKK